MVRKTDVQKLQKLRDQHHRRAVILKYMPERLIEYPFEVVVAFWGTVAALPLVIEAIRPPSLQALPFPLEVAFKILFFAGSVLMAVGLTREKFFPVLPRAMQIVAAALTAYAMAQASASLKASLINIGLLLAISSVLWIRSWWIRTKVFIELDIAREIKEAD